MVEKVLQQLSNELRNQLKSSLEKYVFDNIEKPVIRKTYFVLKSIMDRDFL